MKNEQLKLAEKHFGKYVYEARGIFDAFTTELLAATQVPSETAEAAEDLRSIIADIAQHIEQGKHSEALLNAQRPGYGTGVFTHISRKLDDIRAIVERFQAGNPANNKWWFDQGKKVAAPPAGISPAPLAEAMQMLWDDQSAEEKAHYLAAIDRAALSQGEVSGEGEGA